MANPGQATTISLNVINQTANSLTVIGHQGSDFGTSLACNQTCAASGGQLVVATFPPLAKNDRWDWVYLLDNITKSVYQIYIEVTDDGTPYAFFGYFDGSSSESNSNPSPFDPECSLISWNGDDSILDYILISTPASKLNMLPSNYGCPPAGNG